jgi:multisubunit Na+/H+ antiporter MnhE subunit
MTSADRSSGRRTLPAVPGWTVEVVAWTLVTWGVWLVSLTALSPDELGVGGGCALLCGLAAAAVRRVVQGHGRPTWAAVRPLLLLPVAVAADTAAVLAAPWRPSRWRHRGEPAGGRIEQSEVPRGGSPVARACRSFAVAVVSASPGSVALEADPESGKLVVHAFGSAGPTLASRYAGR